MGKIFKTFRMMDIFKVPTIWEVILPAHPTPAGIVDLFESNAATKEQIKAQVDKVLRNTAYCAQTPAYFKIFGTN